MYETTDEAVQRALEDSRLVDLQALLPASKPAAWALEPSALRFLVSLVEHLEPRHVLEFGSGLSTEVLARASVMTGRWCRITSVDHDPEFIESARARAMPHVQDARLSFVLAPLVARSLVGDRHVPVYYLPPELVANTEAADLILIDGPPNALGGREGVFYQAMAFARPGTLILIDDGNRAAERAAVAEWQSNFGAALRVRSLPGFAKGLVAVTVVEVLQPEDLEEIRHRLVAESLESHLQPETVWIVVDNGRGDLRAFAGCRCLPFLEHDGQYWGPPGTDEQAIAELERLRRGGASHIVFLSDAFWWLDHYAGFSAHLDRSFACVVCDQRLVVFDLRLPPDSAAARS